MASFSSNFSAILALAEGAAAADLETTLVAGNTTGGNDIIFSNGDGINTADNGAGAGFDLSITGSDAGAGDNPGGDINLVPGLGSGTGADGVVNITGDLVVTGEISSLRLISGTGSPEGLVTATVSTIFQRTNGGAGNSTYIKQSGAGNTGWVPAGPSVFEDFVAAGSTMFTTSRAVFEDTQALGVENLAVYWNGSLQRGGGDDYSVTYGGVSATITFVATPTVGDHITIRYLPE